MPQREQPSAATDAMAGAGLNPGTKANLVPNQGQGITFGLPPSQVKGDEEGVAVVSVSADVADHFEAAM